MKYLLALITALTLSGCASTGFNNTEVLVTKEYIVRTAPDVLKTLPALPPALPNPKTATNSQIAAWISNTEEYTANLEAMIMALVNFYEKPVTASETAALKPNAAGDTTGAARPAGTTTAAPASSAFSSPLQRARAGQ